MKRLFILVLAFFLCSQICFAEERTETLILKDGTEVTGESIEKVNGVYRVKTDSEIIEVKSDEVAGISYEVNYTWDDFNIKKEDFDRALEKINERLDNYSDNNYVEETYDSDYQDDSYENESYDSDYQNDSYENDSYDSDSDYQEDD